MARKLGLHFLPRHVVWMTRAALSHLQAIKQLSQASGRTGRDRPVICLTCKDTWEERWPLHSCWTFPKHSASVDTGLATALNMKIEPLWWK